MKHTLTLFITLICVSPALANVAAPVGEAARLYDASTPKTLLEVEHETLKFECSEQGRRPVCTFRATYRIANPTSAAQKLTPVFYGIRSEGIAITVEGAPVDETAAPELFAASDATLVDLKLRDAQQDSWLKTRDPQELARTYHDALEPMQRTGFVLEVAPESRVELVATGTLSPGQLWYSTYAVQPPRARHLLIGDEHDEVEHFEFDYAVFPIRTWARYPASIEVEVRHPAHWDMRLKKELGERERGDDGEAFLHQDRRHPASQSRLHPHHAPLLQRRRAAWRRR